MKVKVKLCPYCNIRPLNTHMKERAKTCGDTKCQKDHINAINKARRHNDPEYRALINQHNKEYRQRNREGARFNRVKEPKQYIRILEKKYYERKQEKLAQGVISDTNCDPLSFLQS
jgi:hypothetical protein